MFPSDPDCVLLTLGSEIALTIIYTVPLGLGTAAHGAVTVTSKHPTISP